MLVNDGGTATQPKAPSHDRPHAALRAARHGRLSAAPRAPGADVPPATTAEAPGQYCLRAALLAPGHDRPRAALRAAWHGRPSAAPRAPGADVPPATPAEAPGQYCLRAAPCVPVSDRSRPVQKAPGHDRPRAASSDAVRHDRPSATLRAPGAGVPLATTAGAPGQHRLRAMANATVALPAGSHRLRQEGLPHTPANPRTLTHQHTHQDTTNAHPLYRRATRYAQSRERDKPPLSTWWRGAGGEAHPPHHPPSAARHPSTAPPAALLHRGHGPLPSPPLPRPTARSLVIAAQAATHVPPQCGGTIGGPTHSRSPHRLPFPGGKGPGVRSTRLTTPRPAGSLAPP